MNVLFINACVRKESRTLVVARDLLRRMDGTVTELRLAQENLSPLNEQTLAKREALLKANERDDETFRYARQFARADHIVIAAPFWDLSFPALLKIYLEQITVAGITFTYRNGRVEGLCNAKSLSYVTTAGGEIVFDFGYTYVKALAKGFYGIPRTTVIRAENLDVLELTAQNVLQEASISVQEE